MAQIVDAFRRHPGPRDLAVPILATAKI